MSSLPTWTTWSIAAAAVLSPVLAFLMAIAIEILIGLVKDAGLLALLALAIAGVIGWVLFASSGCARIVVRRPRREPASGGLSGSRSVDMSAQRRREHGRLR
jgi:UPF0716 family protein affecting phage T7 exclusion